MLFAFRVESKSATAIIQEKGQAGEPTPPKPVLQTLRSPIFSCYPARIGVIATIRLKLQQDWTQEVNQWQGHAILERWSAVYCSL
jgi:hypothetical protein